jgi:hypothetical protein
MNNLGQCAKAVLVANDTFKKFPPYYGITAHRRKTRRIVSTRICCRF